MVSDGFEEGADAEVSGAAEDAFCGAYDEVEGLWCEGAVGQCDVVELFDSFQPAP
ncbi:MAG: hypothetical protein GY854_24740 [Deltaproteobacteria bacterium]|nr:hypothetical protein [Deltaproteobacteria bacterium]